MQTCTNGVNISAAAVPTAVVTSAGAGFTTGELGLIVLLLAIALGVGAFLLRRAIGPARGQGDLLAALPLLAYRCRPNGEILALSGQVRSLTGRRGGALVGHRLAELVHPDDRRRVEAERRAAWHQRRAYQMGFRLVTTAGDELRVWEKGAPRLHQATEELCGFIAEVRQRSEPLEPPAAEAGEGDERPTAPLAPDLHAASAHAASPHATGPHATSPHATSSHNEVDAGPRIESTEPPHDHLTGLPGRPQLRQRVAAALDRSRRDGGDRCCLMVLDLDRFKVINDSLGHEEGDRLLGIVGRRLASCVTPPNLVARLGGDEFVVLVEDLPTGAGGQHRESAGSEEGSRDGGAALAASRIAARLLSYLEMPVYLAGEEVFPTASIGIALGDAAAYEQPHELLRDAEIAMYGAKTQGGGRHQLFDREMHRRTLSRLRLESDLRRAIERGQLQLLYQPILRLDDGFIAGYEALLRWNHPQRGRLLPAEFLPLALETGAIEPLTWWVLGQACRQLAAWRHQDPELFITVNLTGQLLESRGFAARLERLRAEHKLPAGSVHLELSESSLLDTPGAEEALIELCENGVVLALDDFGTGYSSLSSLARLPVHQLKIDRAFTAALDDQPDGREMVRSIILMGRNLELATVAEGVETAAQAETLRSMGCDYGQGYLFDRPLAAPDAAEQLLRQRHRRARRQLGQTG